MKKRGFGKGKWNGPGGKINENETIEQCAIRELYEETKIKANIKGLNKVGLLYFGFATRKDWNVDVNIFSLSYDGESQETEEMKPERFAFDQIPYEQMWEADRIWLQKLIEGEKNFQYKFYYNDEGELIDYKRII